jgi:hypothetical protein
VHVVALPTLRLGRHRMPHPARVVRGLQHPGRLEPCWTIPASGTGQRRGADDSQALRVPGTGTALGSARRALDGLVIVDASQEVIIFGEVIDESHLHGILALVRSLDLHLVSMYEVADRK